MRFTLTRIFISISLLSVFWSCGTLKKSHPQSNHLNKLADDTIIEKHEMLSKSMISMSSKVELKSNVKGKGMDTSLSLRFKKDSIIWLSASFGLVKLRFTKDSISYYNKLNKTYFAENYTTANKMFDLENIDYNIIQQILFGMIKDKYSEPTEKDSSDIKSPYTLKRSVNPKITALYKFGPSFRLKRLNLFHKILNLSLKTHYSYPQDKNQTIPHLLTLNLNKGNSNELQATIKYTNLELNKTLNYPFKIPKNYTKLSML